jgi:CBS domain containing-hemolysin-like protein
VTLALAALLILGNALFVGAEFSLIAARGTQLEPLAVAGGRRAQTALRAMGQIPVMIAGAQLGITICSLGLGALAEPALARLLLGPLELTPLGAAPRHAIAFAIALGIVVYLHTVVGEMVPKNVALAGPERAALWLVPPLWWFSQLTRPLLVALKWLARVLLRVWGIRVDDSAKTVFTADELASLAGQAHTEGLLDAGERARITGALTLTSRDAASVMRPWSTVVTVPVGVTAAQLEALAVREHHSRYPVLDGAAVLGFVHLKEVLDIAPERRDAPLLPSALRPLAQTAPGAPLTEILVRMRRERAHLMLVTGTEGPGGIVALDDVLSAVVGAPHAL